MCACESAMRPGLERERKGERGAGSTGSEEKTEECFGFCHF